MPTRTGKRAENINRKAHERQRAAKEAAGWRFHERWEGDGHLPLIPGRKLRIRGLRGQFKFVEAVTNPAGVSWLTVWRDGHGMRSVDPERVKSVARQVD